MQKCGGPCRSERSSESPEGVMRRWVNECKILILSTTYPRKQYCLAGGV